MERIAEGESPRGKSRARKANQCQGTVNLHINKEYFFRARVFEQLLEWVKLAQVVIIKATTCRGHGHINIEVAGHLWVRLQPLPKCLLGMPAVLPGAVFGIRRVPEANVSEEERQS